MLKKVLVLSAVALALSVSGFAQKVEKPIFVGLTVGGATALGDFGSTSKSDGDKFTGVTTYGYTANLHGGYYFHKNIGVAAQVGYNTFFTNTNKYQENLKASSTAGYTVADATVSGGISTGINLLIGPRGAVQAGSVEFYLQPMIGYSTLMLSDLVTSTREVKAGTAAYNSDNKIQTQKINSGLSYGASLGLRTAINKRVGFLLDLNYLNLGSRTVTVSTTGTKTEAVVASGGALSITYPSINEPAKDKIMAVSSFSANFGISIHF